MNLTRTIAAVEIGTGKVVVLAARLGPSNTPEIVGRGEVPTKGVKKGEIVEFRAVSEAVHQALAAAEKNAKQAIEGVYLSQTGRHLQGIFRKGSVSVGSHEGIVDKADLKTAVDEAKRQEIPNGRVFIHHIRSGMRLDGRQTSDPIGMAGSTLEVAYWHVHGDESKVADNVHVINGYSIDVEDLIISSAASGCVVAEEDDKENGCLVLDIGRGTTDWVLYLNGKLVKTGVVAVGGDHITNDLALGLRVNSKHAENIKHEFAKAFIDPVDKNDKVWLFGDYTIGDRPIPRESIYRIVKARIDELFQIVKREIGEECSPTMLQSGIILTGGTSRLEGICDSAAHITGVPARVGQFPAWVPDSLQEPEYATALGLLIYGTRADQATIAQAQGAKRSGLLGRMAGMFAMN